MKKTIIILSTVLIIATFLIINSCRKKEFNNSIETYNNPVSTKMAIVPDGKTPEYIENQLKWIARVLPWLAENTTNFKSNFHNLLFNDPWLKKHNWPSQTAL